MVSDPHPQTTASVRLRLRRHLFARRFWALVLGLLLLLGGSAWSLLGTTAGARWLLTAVQDQSVQIDGVSGRLIGPLQIAQVSIEQINQRLVLQHVALDWSPRDLLHGLLHITRLQAHSLHIERKIDQQPDPNQLPQRIALPVRLRVDALGFDGATVAKGALPLVNFGTLAMRLDFDGQRYRMQLLQASAQAAGDGAPSAQFRGAATLAVAQPYAFEGRIDSSASAQLAQQTLAGAGQVHLSGSLVQFAVDMNLAAAQARVSGNALIRPFSPQSLVQAQLHATGVDLAQWQKSWPHTQLQLQLDADQHGRGTLQVRNAQPGRIDQQGLPLRSLALAFAQTERAVEITDINAELGAESAAGTLRGDGRSSDGGLSLALLLHQVNLHALDARINATALDGSVTLRKAGAEQTVALALREPFSGHPLSLTARAALSDSALTVQQAELRAGAGRLSAQGRIGWTATRAFLLTGRAQQLRLQDFGQFAGLPALQLNGSFAMSGARSPRLIGEMTFHLDQSSLAGRPLLGDGALHLDGETLALPRLTLRAGDNVLQASGTLLSAQTALRFSLQAPRLEQLGASLAGAASISGTLSGQLRQPQLVAQWNASALRLPGAVTLARTHGNAVLHIDPSRAFALGSALIDANLSGLVTPNAQCAQIDVHLDAAAASQAPLAAHVVATQLTGAGLAARTLGLDVAGTTGRHRITASLDDPAQRWQFGASGAVSSLGPTLQWRGEIERFDGAGKVSMALRAPATLAVTQARVALEHFQLDVNGAQLNISEFLRDQSGIITRGRIDRLALAPWLAMLKPTPAVRTDLHLAAEWNLRVADSLSGSVQVHRESGDVVVLGSVPVALGMSDLTLSLQARDGALSTRLSALGQQFGRVVMDARSQLGHGAARLSLAPAAALAGSATLDVPSLGWLGPALFPGLVSAGHLRGDVAISGTVAQPRYAGHLSGQALRVFFAEQGVDLRNGILDSEFQGERLVLRTLHFEQAGGTLDASGPINLVAGQPTAQISVVARRFALLNRSDRRVIVSGDGEVGWRAQHLNLVGAIRVDGGNIDLGRADAPHLSDDVVIIGTDKKTSAPSALVVDLALDLGDGIALTGRGLDAVLAGQIHVSSRGSEGLRAIGILSIAKGTYSAYGRKLAIEQGVLRFGGPLNNPALDILAMRRGTEVEAGVAVRGTVLLPRVTLVSEPNVSDAEKLSWLVLGKGLESATGGDAGALQTAAAGLLSQGAASGVQSQLASALGLENFSVGTSSDSLQQRIVTVGKQISARLYLSYEQGLASASSVLHLRYTLSPKLTIEAEAGTRSALSLFYNVLFD